MISLITLIFPLIAHKTQLMQEMKMTFLNWVMFQEVKHNTGEKIFMCSYPTKSVIVLMDDHGQEAPIRLLCAFAQGCFQSRIQFSVFQKFSSFDCTFLSLFFSGVFNHVIYMNFFVCKDFGKSSVRVAVCGFGVQKCNCRGSEASKELTQRTGEKTRGILNCWRMDSSWKKKRNIIGWVTL